jgi:serine/threonine-protein kinase
MITPEPGAIIARRYTLTRLLGRGGMGSVWLARHRDLDVEVAIKFMDPALVASAEARMRFEREAKVAAPLSSQHVVQIHDYGVEDGTPYIIMEVLKGESLSARLAHHKRLPPPVVAQLLTQICKALRAAHEAGLVHRDLKPANIFLARRDDEEVVKVLDFGIAKSSGFGEASSETATGMMLGSAHYMSPEQIRSSKEVDHRSDLWSVGIILYRMLTGQLPFAGIDLGDVLVRVCTDVCPRPSAAAPELPAGIDSFFERALARIPVQRFQSAMDLSAAFDAAALNAAALMAPPPKRWNTTVAMHPQISAQASCVSDGPRDSAPTTAWQPPSIEEAIDPKPQASSAAPQQQETVSQAPTVEAPSLTPTPSAEVNPASISAVLVVGRRADSLPRIHQSRADDARTIGRSLRPVAAIAVVVTLAGLVGAATLHGATRPPTLAATTLPASAAPPSVSAIPVASIRIPSAVEPEASAAPLTVVYAAPSASVAAPTRQPGKQVPTSPRQPPDLPSREPAPIVDSPIKRPTEITDPWGKID